MFIGFFDKSIQNLIKKGKIMSNNDIKNFKYLDNLIHSGIKEIVLDTDIVLGDNEKSGYKDGIKLDLDDLAID